MAPLAPGRNVAVVGLGCIGGSMALALTAGGVPVVAWSLSAADRAAASAAGICIVDASENAALLTANAAALVIAVPLAAIGPVAARLTRGLPAGAIIMHTGGLQSAGALGFDAELEERVLGTHPLAGSHDSGFGAARRDLFAGCRVSADARAGAGERALAEWIWHAAGATRVEYRDAADHDRLMVWVSQLPQVAATALAATLAHNGIASGDIGPGARSTTRLAASDYEVWSDLLRGAGAELSLAVGRYGVTLAALGRALESGDDAGLRELWNDGRVWRRDAGTES